MSAQFASLFAACMLCAAHAHGLYDITDVCKNSSSNATAQRHPAVKEAKLSAVISATPEVLPQQPSSTTSCECSSQGDGDDMMLGATWSLSTGGEKFGWCKYAPKASVNCPHCCAIGKVLPPASASRALAELQKAVDAQLRFLKVPAEPSAKCAKRRPDLRSPPQVAPQPEPMAEETEAPEAQMASVDVDVVEELGEVSDRKATTSQQTLSDSGSRIFIGAAEDGGFDAEVAFRNAWAERRAADAARGIGKASEGDGLTTGLTSHEQVMISSMGKLLPAARRVLGLMSYIRA